MKKIIYATARELAREIAAGNVSAVEVVDAHLDHIQRVNPKINAIVTLDADGARARARAADQAHSRGDSFGVLRGVPFTLKDVFETAGMRTTAAFPPLRDNVPVRDATVAARLKAVGGILLGKTNMPALAMNLQSINEVFGVTNNPWNHERSAGGSSGGSAAAVASGMVPFDIGSDMSGSIRIPAHFCGVYGLKPTTARIPITGHIPPLPGAIMPDRHLCTIGPIARSIDDLGFISRVIAGPDGINTDVPPVAWNETPTLDIKRLKIAFLPEFPDTPTARSIRAAVERVAQQLSKAGAKVEQCDPINIGEIRAVWKDYFPLLFNCMMELSGAEMPVKAAGGPGLSYSNWARVCDRRDKLVNAIDRALSEYDAFLTPCVVTNAIKHNHDLSGPFEIDGKLVESRYVDHYLFPFNFTSHPAIALPAGLDDEGLPIGLQLVGKRWSDERLLGVGAAVDQVIDGYRAPPEFAN